MLLNLLQNEKPTHLAVAFDISRYSFRTREYPEYKGTRGETPPEFIGQIPLLEEALHAMNITTITKEDYEADDILATLAAQGASEGFRVLVVSGDRDTIQLVNDDVTLLYPSRAASPSSRATTATRCSSATASSRSSTPRSRRSSARRATTSPASTRSARRPPSSGSTSTAPSTSILEHADEIKGVVGQNLREQQENAVRNRRLNRLLTDVELPVGPADLERTPIDEHAVRDLFARLEFRTLLDRVLKLEGRDGPLDGGAARRSRRRRRRAAHPPVRTLLDEELAPGCEARAADGDAGRPAGRDARRHHRASASPRRRERRTCRGRRAAPTTRRSRPGSRATPPRLLHDAKPQLKALQPRGPRRRRARVRHPRRRLAAAAGPQADSPRRPALRAYLGEMLPEADPNQLVPDDRGGRPGDRGLVHAAASPSAAGSPRRALARRARRHRAAAPRVLVDMELRGVTVDPELLAALSARARRHGRRLAAQRLRRDRPRGQPRLAEAAAGGALRPARHAEDARQQDGLLDGCRRLADLQESNPHPFLDLLLQHRDATKLRQIIETLDKAIDDRRPHPHHLRADRLHHRPHLLERPEPAEHPRAHRGGPRHPRGLRARRRVRDAAHRRLLADRDAHHGAPLRRRRPHRGVQRRAKTCTASSARASSASSRPTSRPAMRTKVKAMSYGLAYGLSAFGLSKQLRIETAEAKQLMADYFERFGAVRDYLRNVVEQAKVDGYTETIFGRRRPFPDLNSANRVLRDNAERAALNAPIQGSAADIIKIAMIGIEADLDRPELGSRMLLQVHDELDLRGRPGGVGRARGDRPRPHGAAPPTSGAARGAGRPRRELERRRALTPRRARSHRVACRLARRCSDADRLGA